MPEAIQACTQYHHEPEKAGSQIVLSAVVAYADHLSHTLGSHPQPDTEEGAALAASLMQIINLTADQNRTVSEKVRVDFETAELIE